MCLDQLLPESSVLLSCRHLVCKACTKALWQVAQGDAERRAKSLFECPVCRSEHCVAHADLDAFLAAHLASNFVAPEAGGPDAASRSSLRRSEEGLATFTVPELRIVVDELRLNVRDAIDRSDIERAAERQLERKVPLGTTAPRTLALLPERCLRRVLDTRAIPHDDCADKEALAIRVEQSPKGSCLGLPPRVLKRMLITFGLGDEVHIDKEELARRVMAGRALHQASQAQKQQPQQSQQQSQQQQSQQQQQQRPHQPQHPQQQMSWEEFQQWAFAQAQAQHNAALQQHHQLHGQQQWQHSHVGQIPGMIHVGLPVGVPAVHVGVSTAHVGRGWGASSSTQPGPPGSRVSPYPNGTHRDEEEQPCCKCSVM